MKINARRLAGAFLAAVSAIGAAPALAEDGLSVTEQGGWLIEVVSYDGRAACTVLREEGDGAALVVSLANDSPFVLPVIEMSTLDDPIGAGQVVMVAGSYRVGVLIDASFDEDGAHIAAYPDVRDGAAALEALTASASVRLEQANRRLVTMRLDGFAEAYEAARAACGQ